MKASAPAAASPLSDKDLDVVLLRFFGPEGMLARGLGKDERRFEHRPQQVEMAHAVGLAIEDRAHLVVEAGTGTGKSYAYLVPMILWALATERKVVVSTHTKALQQQLMERDLPFLHDLLLKRAGLDFRYALCLGTQNYVCPRRLEKAESGGIFASMAEIEQLSKIREFAGSSRTGRNIDLPFEPLGMLWSQVNREGDLCLGKRCDKYDDSFFFKARREQEKAHVLVANHHLLFAHIASGGNAVGIVLPSFDALVIDEAHQAEDVASAYLGLEFSNLGVARLLELLHHRRSGRTVLQGLPLLVDGPSGPLGQPAVAELETALVHAVEEARAALALFFEDVVMRLELDAGRSLNFRLRRPGMLENSLEEPLAHVGAVLEQAGKFAEMGDNAVMVKELSGYADRVSQARCSLNELLQQSRDGYVYWVAVQPRPAEAGQLARVPRLALHGAPVDVAEALQETLFGKICPVVMTSATLTTGGSFEFLLDRLGLTEERCDKPVRTLELGSPFNYPENALLYLARDLPDPTGPGFETQVVARAAELLRRTRGRAFVLCTSFRMVDAAATELRRVLPPEIKVLKQGELSRGQLLNDFRNDISSVLVGTTSFWQGVDVPGESLSCVVLMKLPFAVPDEPMVQARVEALRARGRDAFNEYQVPQAIMMFRQGFGRLIRTQNDRGVVAVLDPRIVTRGYGRTFVASLPACGITESLDEVERFLET